VPEADVLISEAEPDHRSGAKSCVKKDSAVLKLITINSCESRRARPRCEAAPLRSSRTGAWGAHPP
jgi:hypothetical protein